MAKKAKKKRIEDHLVECDKHGRIPGYVICIHVMSKKASAAHVDHPGPGNPIGGISCAECAKIKDMEKLKQMLRLICKGCAEENGFLRKAEMN